MCERSSEIVVQMCKSVAYVHIVSLRRGAGIVRTKAGIERAAREQDTNSRQNAGTSPHGRCTVGGVQLRTARHTGLQEHAARRSAN